MKNAVPHLMPSKNRSAPKPAMTPTIIAITRIRFVGVMPEGKENHGYPRIFLFFSRSYFTVLIYF